MALQHKMKTKLKKIASVQMGYSFRTRLEPNNAGNVAVIQMKDLTDDNSVDRQNITFIELNDLKDHHRVEQNDLVLRSRGQTNTAALVNVQLGSSVVAAPLLRIRIKRNSVLPAYLCWFINQPSSQAFIQSKATGTAVRMVGKSVIDELDVVIPSVEVQQRIVMLEKLSSQEQRLMSELSVKKRQLMSRVLLNFAAAIQ